MAGKRDITKSRILRNISALSSRAKLSPYAFGHSLGMVSIVALLFYTVMAWLSDYSGSVILQQYPIQFSFYDWTIIIGLLQTYVLSYIGGWIFVKIYNESIK